MTVSIPIDMTSQSCSEKSDIRTLDDLIVGGTSQPISKGMELREYDEIAGDVLEYSLSKRINIDPFNSNSSSHEKGDIVVRDGHHHIITSKRTTVEEIKHTRRVPKEPEEYTGNETTMATFKTWKGRYLKTHYNFTHRVGGKSFKMYFNAASTGHGAHVNCHNGRVWHIYDHTTQWHSKWIRECLKWGYSPKFNYAKDIKGIKKNWKARHGVSEPIFIPKSYVSRGTWCYVRTWTNAPIQYKTVIDSTTYNYTYFYNTRRIWSPSEINGFRWKKKTDCGAVFDNKNYTKGVFSPSNGFVEFTFVTVAEIDTIAIGRVICDTISITAYDDKTGDVIASIVDYPIATQLGDSDFTQATNAVLYTPSILPVDTKVKVRLTGGFVSVGRLLTGKLLKLGFSNTIFTNGFKDYSPKEQDQWGNIEYRNGVRVFLYSGTVDLPTKDYDQLNLAFMYIGGQEMIINGSDSHNNTPTNSLDIFQSTMMIGRFTSFKPTTKNKGAIMSNVAGYAFSIEESV